MTTIHTSRPLAGVTETERAISAVAHTVSSILDGALPNGTRTLTRPLPIAFLDDGRRLFLVVDQGATGGVRRAVDNPRSWGVEITTEGDLVADAPDQTAVRSTQRLTPQAAARAARFLLEATA